MSIYIQGGYDQVEKDKLIQNREYQYTLYLFKKIITTIIITIIMIIIIMTEYVVYI